MLCTLKSACWFHGQSTLEVLKVVPHFGFHLFWKKKGKTFWKIPPKQFSRLIHLLGSLVGLQWVVGKAVSEEWRVQGCPLTSNMQQKLCWGCEGARQDLETTACSFVTPKHRCVSEQNQSIVLEYSLLRNVPETSMCACPCVLLSSPHPNYAACQSQLLNNKTWQVASDEIIMPLGH